MDAGIVGREQDLARIDAFLANDGPRALLLEGEAGIGKTTLWRAGVARAQERGYRTIACRPSGAETSISFAALRDLLDPVFDMAADSLPAPQRDALAVALLRRPLGDEALPQGAVAAGVVSLLHRLDEDAPLVVAVDDVQWLDASSEALLAFAARRLGDSRIRLLVARRVGGVAEVPLALDRAFDDSLDVVSIGPLSLGALHRLIRERLDLSLPRPLLRRIHDTSAGNPFFALQLARTVQQRGADEIGDRLPLPDTVHQLLGERLTVLPEGTKRALLLASSSSQPTLRLLDEALAADSATLLEPAVGGGIVQTTGGVVTFAHPLFGSAVYDAATEVDRRRAHERLADVSSDLEERARHLARASPDSDPDVVAALDAAAAAALARGAPGTAAELLEAAIAHLPAGEVEARATRAVDAAAAHLNVGGRGRARRLLETALTELAAGPIRSDVLALLSEVLAGEVHGGERRRALIEQALLEAGDDPRRRAEALLRYDMWQRSQDRLLDALETAREALALAESVGDERLIARALTRTADLEVLLGYAVDPFVHFQGALELDARLKVDAYPGARSMLAVCLVRAGRIDEARPLLLAQRQRALDDGNEEARIWMCLFLAELEWLAARWADATRWAHEGLDLAGQCDAHLLRGAILSVLALVEASRGEVENARAHATEGLALCESIIEVAYGLQNHYVLGFLELSLGNPSTAHEHLARFEISRGIEGTKRISFIGDEIEALVRLGDRERASVLVDELERRGVELHRQTLVGVAARCRALLGVNDDPDAAVAGLGRAIEIFDSLSLPFERARSQLVLGEVQRRARRTRAAREALEAALALFEDLGAPIWAEKARSELGRVGGRSPSGDVLTVTERRVAELVAEGRSNKEVAAALFVTVKAVEANLSRVYTKLGIHSRTELAHLLAREGLSSKP